MSLLQGLTVGILVADGFEQIEMTKPQEALEHALAKTLIISPKNKYVEGWHHMQKGDDFKVDVTLDDIDASQIDALLLPGGVHNPDTLRLNPKAVALVQDILAQQKPVAAICHGPWLLIEAQVLKDKHVTSWASIKTDLMNAGANWQDKATVEDGLILTSRQPDDITLFNEAMLKLFARQQKD